MIKIALLIWEYKPYLVVGKQNGAVQLPIVVGTVVFVIEIKSGCILVEIVIQFGPPDVGSHRVDLG